MQDAGNFKNGFMSCKYHGWTYDLQGSLVMVPHLDAKEMNSTCKHQLKSIAVYNWKGLLFINMAPSPSPFELEFKEMREEIEKSGYVVEDYMSHP